MGRGKLGKIGKVFCIVCECVSQMEKTKEAKKLQLCGAVTQPLCSHTGIFELGNLMLSLGRG